MPPTTRASARRTSGASTPPRPTPWLIESAPPPRVPSPILGGTIVDGVASSQHVSESTRASSRTASAGNQAFLFIARLPAPPLHPGSPVLGAKSFSINPVGVDDPIDAPTHSEGTTQLAPTKTSFHSPPPASLSVFGTSVSIGEEPVRASSLSSQSINTLSGTGPAYESQPLRRAIESANSQFTSTSSSLSPSTSSGQISTLVLQHVNVTNLDDIQDLSIRQNVGNLQRSHPWASVSLCQSMLVRCRFFTDADTTLRKMGGMEFPEKIDSSPSGGSVSMNSNSISSGYGSDIKLQVQKKPEYTAPVGENIKLEDLSDAGLRRKVESSRQAFDGTSLLLCKNALIQCGGNLHDAARHLAGGPSQRLSSDEEPRFPANSSVGGGISSPLPSDRSFGGHIIFNGLEDFKRPGQFSSTYPSNNRGKKSQPRIGTGQQLRSFSKPAQSAPGIFSRAERQLVIASSTETAADRERVSFIANAVLYRAFSVQNPRQYELVSKTYYSHTGIDSFPITSGQFPYQAEKSLLSISTYKGTDRGKFQPLSFDTPDDGKVVLQSINLAFPYVRTSFEELRFGDYIRGRKKAPHLFDLFRKLPAEIRCMIWRFSMPPRTVELRHDYALSMCWTVTSVPDLLHVSREPRYEALKRYTLAFGIAQASSKIYFDFKRDTLFLTYEKWEGDGEYEDELSFLTASLIRSGDASKIKNLALDRDLVEILARRLEEEEEEWYDEGDDSIPKPEIDVIPAYNSLQSLAIVKTTIDGWWYHEFGDCAECDEGDCEFLKRIKKNDKAIFEPSHSNRVAKQNQEYYKQLIAQIKLDNPDWSIPALKYMRKRARRQKLISETRSPSTSCTCGGCHSDSE